MSLKENLASLPRKVVWVWGAGLLARLIMASLAFNPYASDYVKNRTAIAEAISSGNWLYCDVRYDHTPLYPYLSGLMHWLSPDIAFIRALMINLPLAIGDALIPVAIFLLLKKYGRESLGITAAMFYALNPLPILEVGLSHWDGFTTLFLLGGLYFLHDSRLKLSGLMVGFGVLLKQFPLAIVLVALVKERNFRQAFIVGFVAVMVVVIGFLPFLINCPTTFVDNLLQHPLWRGSASIGVGIGTIKDLFRVLEVPEPKLIWLFLFIFLIGFPALRANERNYFYYTGLLMITLAYFTFVTHRQLIVWALPFMTVFCLDKKSLWALMVVLVGYVIRILKPEWYFGLIHLGIGAWFYWQFFREMTMINNQNKVQFG